MGFPGQGQSPGRKGEEAGADVPFCLALTGSVPRCSGVGLAEDRRLRALLTVLDRAQGMLGALSLPLGSHLSEEGINLNNVWSVAACSVGAGMDREYGFVPYSGTKYGVLESPPETVAFGLSQVRAHNSLWQNSTCEVLEVESAVCKHRWRGSSPGSLCVLGNWLEVMMGAGEGEWQL